MDTSQDLGWAGTIILVVAAAGIALLGFAGSAASSSGASTQSAMSARAVGNTLRATLACDQVSVTTLNGSSSNASSTVNGVQVTETVGGGKLSILATSGKSSYPVTEPVKTDCIGQQNINTGQYAP